MMKMPSIDEIFKGLALTVLFLFECLTQAAAMGVGSGLFTALAFWVNNLFVDSGISPWFAAGVVARFWASVVLIISLIGGLPLIIRFIRF